MQKMAFSVTCAHLRRGMSDGREGGGYKQRQFTISIINVTSAQQHNARGAGGERASEHRKRFLIKLQPVLWQLCILDLCL